VGEAALVVLGAVVGALATGGVAAYVALLDRRVRRKVAARVVLGDPYVLEAATDVILEHDRWPDRLDLDAPLETWREQREPLAAAVEAWEWALVDGLFSNLHRTAPMARLGEQLTPADRTVLKSVQTMIPRAREIVLKHSGSESELKAIPERIGSDAYPGVQA
jgi:hypothetical protein